MKERATTLRTIRTHTPTPKISEEDVREIRSLYFSRRMSLADLVAKYGLTTSHISAIINGFKPPQRRGSR